MDMTALMEAEIRAALAEATVEALQESQAEAQKEIGRLTSLVEQGDRDKMTLVACQSECKDLETQLIASQLKVAGLSARLDSAAQERTRSDRIFNEIFKRIDTQQEEVPVIGDIEFDIQRGSDGLIRKIVKKG